MKRDALDIQLHNTWCKEYNVKPQHYGGRLFSAKQVTWHECSCGFLFDKDWATPEAVASYKKRGIDTQSHCAICIGKVL